MNFGDMSFQDYFLSGTSNNNLADLSIHLIFQPQPFCYIPGILFFLFLSGFCYDECCNIYSSISL